MRRSVSILLWILTGALASGIGVGYFLHQANIDRETLIKEATMARAQASSSKIQLDKLAEEANTKLDSAWKEVGLAKKQLQEQRILLAQAVVLQKPLPAQKKYWKTIISVPLGFSIEVPPGSEGSVTDNLVSLLVDPPVAGGSDWLDISTYDKAHEDMWMSYLEDTTSTVAFLANGNLLHGVKGRIRDTAATGFVLRIGDSATSTHLLWARNRVGISDQKIFQTVATLSLRS